VEAAMTDARAEVLARITAIPRAAAPEPVRDYRVRGSRLPDEVVQLFCDRVADYRAEVVRAPAASIADVVDGILGAQNAMRVGIPSGLRAEWRPAGCELVDEQRLDTAGFDTLAGAVTGCTVAIAETGTIVLASGPEEGRRALTLVPDLHVCVVERAQIVELVPAGVRRAGELVKRERLALTFVSGPSATSDIELDRVEGVHGPRRLVVIVAE
jgi:L-lactate dehydrogenase complex protein LldG